MLKIFKVMTLLVAASFFSVLFQVPASSQTPEAQAVESDEIEIPFQWQVGDKRQYSVKRVDYKGGEVKSEKKTIFAVEIVSENEDVLIAKCNVSIAMDPQQRMIAESNPTAKKMLEIYKDLVLLIRIGNDGTFRGFKNEKEVKAAFQKTVDVIKDASEEVELDDDKKVIANRLIKEITNFERFQRDLLAPLNLMLMNTNTSHSKTEVYEQASTINMMFVRDVPTTEEYQIESIDSDQKNVTLLYSQIVEGEIAAKMVKDGIEAFAKRMDPNSDETVEISGVISKTNGKFVMNYENGWPEKIEWKAKVSDFKTGILNDKSLIEIDEIKPRPGAEENSN